MQGNFQIINDLFPIEYNGFARWPAVAMGRMCTFPEWEGWTQAGAWVRRASYSPVCLREPAPVKSLCRRGRRPPGLVKLTVFDNSQGALLPWRGPCELRYVFSLSLSQGLLHEARRRKLRKTRQRR